MAKPRLFPDWQETGAAREVFLRAIDPESFAKFDDEGEPS